ncbi:hypothetical protein TCON_1790 [Astathelohania contejeani]|uniref:Ricin B lectin domain-containing protein n=1 Tax=Astathelohania contejeani TaxID=164912 RepID=A0ABQ7HXU5_9MICR|nr:hypothetical protein TCON_1790 [Thelohania contejeani]
MIFPIWNFITVIYCSIILLKKNPNYRLAISNNTVVLADKKYSLDNEIFHFIPIKKKYYILYNDNYLCRRSKNKIYSDCNGLEKDSKLEWELVKIRNKTYMIKNGKMCLTKHRKNSVKLSSCKKKRKNQEWIIKKNKVPIDSTIKSVISNNISDEKENYSSHKSNISTTSNEVYVKLDSSKYEM